MNALVSRSSSHLLKKNLFQDSVRSQVMRSMTVISKKSAEDYKKLNYNARMEKTGRPMSPHMTVFAFPIIAVSSGFNRLTGTLMSLGCAGFGALDIIGGSGTSLHLMQWVASQPWPIVAFSKFAVSFPIAYHYQGALRHFLWDFFPEYLNNEQCEQSAYIIFGTTAVVCGTAMIM